MYLLYDYLKMHPLRFIYLQKMTWLSFAVAHLKLAFRISPVVLTKARSLNAMGSEVLLVYHAFNCVISSACVNGISTVTNHLK